MTNLFKRFFTHKSKFLLIILCLLGMVFSYSCSCRNDSTGPGNDGNGGNGGGSGNDNNTPTWSFSPAPNLDNTYNISFKSDGEKKRDAVVTFYEPDSHEIKKIEIEEVQDPKNVLTKDKMQHKDGKLIIPQDILKKLADGLTSTDKPATNKVSIVFKLTSTNATSSDNIKYITNTFNFIKAKKIDKDNIESILRKGNDFKVTESAVTGDKNFYFYFTNGNYQDVGKYFIVTNNTTDNLGIPKSKAKDYIGYNFDTILTNEGIKGTLNPSLESEEGSSYILGYDIDYGDYYEGDITPIKVKLENKSANIKFE